MAGEYSGRRSSNTQLLDELETLSKTLYQPPISTNRRTASLVLPRDSVPYIPAPDDINATKVEEKPSPRPKSRRLSMSPWRGRPKLDDETEQEVLRTSTASKFDDKAGAGEKKGLWNWKPIRALSHIGMQKLSCLFSVEVVTAQGLPTSMNGLRLAVCVRKKETKDGAVHTMPSRVSQGAADFEETLFVKCHVYYTPANGKHQLKFEPRPFLLYLFAVDAQELDFGRNSVDFSKLIQESMEKISEDTRVRQWDLSFKLSGKAKGGELVLNVGFQIMEKDGGIGIYSQEGSKNVQSKKTLTSFARKQSKGSFSVPSPRMTSQSEAWTPSDRRETADLQGIDDLDLDEPAPVPSSVQKPNEPKPEPEPEVELEAEDDLPDFEVVDKGTEIQGKEETAEGDSDGTFDERSISSEVVKEVMYDQLHQKRLTELDSIAQQIKALESMMGGEKLINTEEERGNESQRLDEDEATVTIEFLQMLESEDGEKNKVNQSKISTLQLDIADDSRESESEMYLSDLGKGIGCVVQTRDGGYLGAMNPLNTIVVRKETPKLAMQISKPMVLSTNQSGFEFFQRMAAIGVEELCPRILSLMPLDELMGKTAEQIAFEGIASAIIQGRNKEGASSSAARTVETVKTMATAMITGRKERISTGIWNADEDPMTAEEVLAYSLQSIETLAIEALKIQADMAEEDAPFDVSPIKSNEKDPSHPLASALPLEDWTKNYIANSSESEPEDPSTLTVAVTVQLRDPLRRYEAVGAPVIALIQATSTGADKDDEEKRFKTSSLHVGGFKVHTVGKRGTWDADRQRLTAMHWLVACGLGKSGKKGKKVAVKKQDLLWSMSSRVMADMWLKPMRNPDVKISK